MEISKISINGKVYEVVDKESRAAISKWTETYLPYPSIKKEVIESQNISEYIRDGFKVLDYPYFYFYSTSKDRVLYTKAGNTLNQNRVYLSEYLSNEIDDLDEGELITIYYGN